jgi:predicted metal-dependent phosphoesterase TrpH
VALGTGSRNNAAEEQPGVTTTEESRRSAFGARAWVAGGAGLLGVGVLLGAAPGSRPVAPLRHLPPVPKLAAPALAATATAEAAAASGAPAAGGPAAFTGGAPRFADTIDVSTFQKGNIHTHTNLSDGDHPPEHVYAWYRERGYNFLAITDHNNLTEPSRWRALEQKKRFVMITGEEVTMRGAGKQVHVNALCTKQTIGGKSFDTQGQALAWAVRQITEQGGVALVNHPNWDWALTAADLPAAQGARLLEIESGHPYVHTQGDAEHLSHEAIWDAALGAGQDLAGVAVDDAHIYGPRAPENAARPGRAWIQVFAAEPTRQVICEALGQGRFYASTGVTLRRIVVKDDAYAVYPADASALVEFVGQGGRVLQSGKAERDGAARYRLTGGEGYVRARVTTGDGKHAWTQPSRVVR